MLGQEIFGLDACLSENGSQRPFRHITRVVGNGGIPASGGIVPDFMAAGGLPLEYESKSLETSDDFSIPESGQAAYYVATNSG